MPKFKPGCEPPARPICPDHGYDMLRGTSRIKGGYRTRYYYCRVKHCKRSIKVVAAASP